MQSQVQPQIPQPMPPQENIRFRLAELSDVQAARAFFARLLPPGSDAVYNEEFYCPLGIKAAIQRKQMLLALDERRIVGAVRFYPKKNGEFSLYQFAVEPDFRGQNLARAMFDAIRAGQPMRSLCPSESNFNRYYQRTGWQAQPGQQGLNCWLLCDAPAEAQS